MAASAPYEAIDEYHVLSLAGQDGYKNLRQLLLARTISSCRRAPDELETVFRQIRTYCEQTLPTGDSEFRMRCLVCGVMPVDDEQLWVNTRNLKITTGKSKSTLNALIKGAGFVHGRCKEPGRAMPELKTENKLRQWTLRVREGFEERSSSRASRVFTSRGAVLIPEWVEPLDRIEPPPAIVRLPETIVRKGCACPRWTSARRD